MKWLLQSDISRVGAKVVLLMFFAFKVHGQRQTVKTNMFWIGYYNNVGINNRWSVNTDIQARTRDWADKFSQGLIRSGLACKVGNNFSVTVGGAWFKNAEYVQAKLVVKNEFRPWQELAFQHKIKNTRFSHRLRSEQRFLQQLQQGKKSDVYDRLSRLRYKIDAQVPLIKNLNLVLANEVMCHPGYLSDKRFFDQDRLSVALNLKVSQPVSLQWQYMKIYQSRSNATIMEDANVFRFLVYHNINFKK